MTDEFLELEDAKLTNSESTKTTIHVNKDSIRAVVKDLGYIIDKDGHVANEAGEKILSGNLPVKLSEIGAILPANSPHIFIRNNLGSISTYIAEKE